MKLETSDEDKVSRRQKLIGGHFASAARGQLSLAIPHLHTQSNKDSSNFMSKFNNNLIQQSFHSQKQKGQQFAD
jgi:hypothetical protein